MIHTLTSQIRQYKRDSFLAPLFTMLESVMALTQERCPPFIVWGP